MPTFWREWPDRRSHSVVRPTSRREAAARHRLRTAALAALVLTLLMGATCAGPAASTPDAGGVTADAGLLLAVLVPPVILVSLAWLAYVFRLLFREPPEEPPPRKR